MTKMVTLVVTTTTDPTSINPAKEILGMTEWVPGQALEDGIKSYVNERIRLLEMTMRLEEDNLDGRWEKATTEIVQEVIFMSKHTAVSNKPALTARPIGIT